MQYRWTDNTKAHLRRTGAVVPGIHRVIGAAHAREAVCPPRCALRIPLHKAQEPNRPAQRRG